MSVHLGIDLARETLETSKLEYVDCGDGLRMANENDAAIRLSRNTPNVPIFFRNGFETHGAHHFKSFIYYFCIRMLLIIIVELQICNIPASEVTSKCIIFFNDN